MEIGAGLANSSISQWKKGKGKPSLDNIVKLSKFFHVSSDYLLCLTDDCASENEISLTSDEKSPEKQEHQKQHTAVDDHVDLHQSEIQVK